MKQKRLPKLTIVTPSFNQAHFIEQTIQSVLNQNYPNLEYLVIDGGSTDGTIEILKKYTGKLKWISEKDKGQSDALNKGFQLATGDIVGYIPSDDYYAPGTFQIVTDYFSAHPDAKLLTGDYFIVDERNIIHDTYVRWYKKFLWLFNSHQTFVFANYSNAQSTFWKRELFQEFGLMDTSLHFVFDYEWWLRVSSKYKIHLIQKPLGYFRIHKGSKSGSQYIKAFKEDFEAGKRHTSNPFILGMKWLHNQAIVTLYRFTRF
jgi:glycosyltransferase involved in cell wall biosynthesis